MDELVASLIGLLCALVWTGFMVLGTGWFFLYRPWRKGPKGHLWQGHDIPGMRYAWEGYGFLRHRHLLIGERDGRELRAVNEGPVIEVHAASDKAPSGWHTLPGRLGRSQLEEDLERVLREAEALDAAGPRHSS